MRNFRATKISRKALNDIRSSLSHEIQSTPMGFLGDANQKSIVPDLAVLSLLLFFFLYFFCYCFSLLCSESFVRESISS